MDEGPKWTALESNPEALNKFLRNLGIPEPWQFVDMLGFEADLLALIPQPVAAVIFCFPTLKRYEDEIDNEYKLLSRSKSESQGDQNIFFMKQHIENACGTYSTLHALANSEIVDKGSGAFHSFYERAKSLKTPEEKSKVLQSDKEIEKAHEDCASAGSTDASDVSHHFIAFLPKNGKLMEFDSGQDFPRSRGSTTQQTFLGDVAKLCSEICSLISSYGETKFNAMALVGSKFD